MAAYHPIFDRFPPFEGVVPAGFTADFSGVLVDPRMFDPEAPAPAEPRFMRIGTPTCTGEGYFDLIALAHAVDAARGRFVMIELGAGYGYWLSEGGGLARRRGLAPFLVGVEADPGHFELMRRHLANNGFKPEESRLFEAAVPPVDGEVYFTVGPEWGWGQAIVDDPNYRQEGTDGQVHQIPAIALTTILADLEWVDALHMDVQGVEFEVLQAAKSEVDRKVRTLIIGTESPTIETNLRALFEGWHSLFDFRMGEVNRTEYGDIQFGDGLQVWVNPVARGV
jgi:FkbM family methyltransferase